MNQRIIYILNILLFLAFFSRTNVVLAFDGEVYVEETAAQLSEIITANQLLISEGKAAQGTYLLNKFKDIYNVDLINSQDVQDIEAALSTLNGEVAVVVHAPYAVGAGGIKKALIDVNMYSSAIFSKLKVAGKELVLVNVWTIFHSDGKFASYQVSVLQTANVSPKASTYGTNLTTFLDNSTHSLTNINQGLKGAVTTSSAKLSFTDDELISTELTSTAQINLSDIYLTPSCEYIQFSVAISDPRYRGIYLVAFTYQGKQYSYCTNVVTQKEGNKETITGQVKTATTSFLPFKTMKALPTAEAIGFKKVICENGDYLESVADSWYFKDFSIKPCDQVSSFQTNNGSTSIANIATCQAYINNCNSANGSSNGAVGGSSNLVNYSQDANGVSMITDAEYNSILGKVNGMNTAFGVSVKTYILSKKNPNYDNLLNEAKNDQSSSKFILVIDGDKTDHTIHLQHKFGIPDWLRPSTSLANDDGCISDYINESLDKLHKNELYKASILSDQIIAEYSVALYRGVFGSLYCLTSENAVSGKGATVKFLAGALHELIATVDVVDMIDGLVEVAKGATKAIISSQTSYLLDIKQTYIDISNGTEIPINVLMLRLMPPDARLAVNAYNTVSTISNTFVKFYFTDCEKVDLYGSDMCAYRYGQVTIMVIPIALTLGEWAWVKAGQLSTRLRTFKALSRTEEVVNVLTDAEKIAGSTIDEASNIITIKEGENITTIEHANNKVVIKKNGVEIVEGTGKRLKLIAKLDNLPDAKAFVNSLDEITDATLLQNIDNLTPTQLDKLNTFYKNRPSPEGFSSIDYNFTATKVIDGNPVSITYKYGLPDFKGNSPILNFVDGTPSGKFMYQSQSLKGYGADFLEANTALSKKMGIEKVNGQWPQVNSDGFLQNGNFRWRKTGSNLSQRFELFENGSWVEYTWHHFEDGTTMFPVKSKIHSTSDGGFAHPGGGSIIGDGNITLKGIFEFSGF